MKKGLLMMLCLSLLITAPGCFKKKDRAEKNQPATVKKTKTYTKKEKSGDADKKMKHKVKKVKTEKKSKSTNGAPKRTETVTTEDMTTSKVIR